MGLARILLAIVVLVLIAIVCIDGLGLVDCASRICLSSMARLRCRGSRLRCAWCATSRACPTIEAATLEDLFFAQGYVTAQDRLWQMDIMRRAAAGELSEVVGEATLKIDRQQRILGLRSVAEAAAKKI